MLARYLPLTFAVALPLSAAPLAAQSAPRVAACDSDALAAGSPGRSVSTSAPSRRRTLPHSRGRLSLGGPDLRPRHHRLLGARRFRQPQLDRRAPGRLRVSAHPGGRPEQHAAARLAGRRPRLALRSSTAGAVPRRRRGPGRAAARPRSPGRADHGAGRISARDHQLGERVAQAVPLEERSNGWRLSEQSVNAADCTRCARPATAARACRRTRAPARPGNSDHGVNGRSARDTPPDPESRARAPAAGTPVHRLPVEPPDRASRRAGGPPWRSARPRAASRSSRAAGWEVRGAARRRGPPNR